MKTPNCPSCSLPPKFPGLLPYFCFNDDCEVLHWDPRESKEKLLAGKTVVDFDADDPFPKE